MTQANSTFEDIDGIAIIGLSGHFPGADSVDELWQNLCNGVESITFFSAEELIKAGRSPAEVNAPNYVRAQPILRNIKTFDAAFFDMLPREAQVMDPQKRLFLECCWEALENAGYAPATYDDWVGVFGGNAPSFYYENNLRSNADLLGAAGGMVPVVFGNVHDYLTTRVSYKLNLKGPSFDLQCACSTSLVAVHVACLSLSNYQCDMALAGGVTILASMEMGYQYEEGSLWSPDGHCRPFDAKAEGTVFGSGVGVVALKRLSDALRDGDHIYAVIRGMAVTNDGAAKVGFTAPGVDGQKRAISMAQQEAGVDPETISYIEAHGTGTSLGDPIEIEALTQVFRDHTDKKQFCAIGSIKGNVGHLDCAAGIISLIKTTLALRHKTLPPSINFETPNPQIDFANSPFYVNTGLREWKTADGQPRRAGVSAFGVGGTDAHAILEEAPEMEPSSESRRYQLLVLSARTETALEAMTNNLVAHLQADPNLKLADAVYTLHVGRQAFEKRRMVVCKTTEDAVAALQGCDPARVLTGMNVKSDRPVAFMFSGQGAQYVNMGRDLYQHEPAFREQVDACAESLKPHLGLDLRDVLYPSAASAEDAIEQLEQTALTQPALFVIEYAMARLLMAWGVKPAAMIGHSIGEYVAACLAGVFGLEDALALVAARGRLMQSMPPGSMLSVPLTEADVQPLLGDSLTVATINGPERCVVSGPTEAIAALEQQLNDKGIAARQLHTSHAFHSAMMEPILKPFEERVRQVSLNKPQIPYISNVTGTWVTPQEATDPAYWARHLRQAVRFSDGVSVLAQSPEWVLLEVGPGRTLRTLAQRHPDRAAEQVVTSSMRHPQDDGEDDAFLPHTLGQLWLTGVSIDWRAFYQGEQRLRVPLPTYPFERQRFWIEDTGVVSAPVSLAKQPDLADWFYVPLWKQSVLTQLGRPTEQQLRWLVFLDGCGLGNSIANHLQQAGQEVLTVVAGEAFSQTENGAYVVNPRLPDDYNTLFAELERLDRFPHTIVHLWSVAPAHQDRLTDERFEESQAMGFYSLLYLAQAISKRQQDYSLRIEVVSNNLQPVAGEVLCPEKATLLGPCRVIPQELVNVVCRSIDVVAPESGVWPDELVESLAGELLVMPSDPLVAYRGRHRWVQTYEPVRLDAVAGPPKTLREGGVYLITGGLGGIGLAIAEYLARTVRARLVLTGRSPFPARDEWEQWLTAHDEQDGVSRRIRKLQALEGMGAQILVLSADVADLAQMQAVVSQICGRFGMIHGVIHAAGVAGGGVIQLKTVEMAARVLAPKVRGTLVLAELFRDSNLDFLVLLSSLTSIMGGLGQVDYGAANAFLDAFAHRGVAPFTTTIDWDTWQEVGMAVDTAAPSRIQQWREEDLKRGILSAEGTEAFARILAHRLNQVLVSAQDFHARLQQSRSATASGVLEALEQARLSAPKHRRPALEQPYSAPRNQTEQTLTKIWQDLLGIDQVGIHDSFFDLGGDSLLAMQIVTWAGQAGIKFTSQQFLKHPTIAELTTLEGVVSNQAEQGLVAGPLPPTVSQQWSPEQGFAEPNRQNANLLAEQGLVTGPLPLTSAQRWFLGAGRQEPDRFNSNGLYKARQRLDPVLMEQVVQHLLVHHDALRSRFVHDESGWHAFIAEPEGMAPVICVDLSELPETVLEAAVNQVGDDLQGSLSLSEGPLLRVGLYDLGIDRPGRLHITMHHMALDAHSIAVLLEDFQTAYLQLVRGEPIRLLPKTTSIRQWLKRLISYAQSAEMRQELDYWLNLPWVEAPHLPVDFPEGRQHNTIASNRSVEVWLSSAETDILLHQALRTYNAQILDVLLMGLVQAASRWTGKDWVAIGLADYGRGIIPDADDVDLSRTVGWLAHAGMILLKREETDNPGDALCSIRDQFRRIPNRGLGFDLLVRYGGDEEMSKKLFALCNDDLKLNYMGSITQQTADETSPIQPVQGPWGNWQNPQNQRADLLYCPAFVAGDQLVVKWEYSENIYKRATIEALANDFAEALRALIAYCNRTRLR